MISDDVKLSCAETYGSVISRASHLACYMRQKFNNITEGTQQQQDRVVALWAESCPEAVSGILGILAIPAAYMPMSIEEHLSGKKYAQNVWYPSTIQ